MVDQAEICSMVQSQMVRDRIDAAKLLKDHFSTLQNRSQAWQDLHILALDKDADVRWSMVDALNVVFSQVPDKVHAWKDLIRLAQDEVSYIRGYAIQILGSVFCQVPNTDEAWLDLIALTQDEKCVVRSYIAFILGSVYGHVLDKDKAWLDIVWLTQDGDTEVQKYATQSLGNAFSQVRDKEKAWKDFHVLTKHSDSTIRWKVAEALGTAFSQIPDRTQAWQDLLRLSQDDKNIVRMGAYSSLGRASIFKAAEALNKMTMKRELENAIGYFEKSSQEDRFRSSTVFCSKLYRSYYALTFENAKKEKVDQHLAEAKWAVRSKGGFELLKTVENLSKALYESQNLGIKSLEELATDINAYRLYCEKASKHLNAAEEIAPEAVKLMRKCNTILEENIQITILDIQKKAKQICETIRGSWTEYEDLGIEINRVAKCLSLDDPIKVYKCSLRMAFTLRTFCSLPGLLPEENRLPAYDALENIEKDIDLSSILARIELSMAYTLPAIRSTNAVKKEIIESNMYLHNKTTGTIIDYIDKNSMSNIECIIKAIELMDKPDQQLEDFLQNLNKFIWILENLEIGDPKIEKLVKSAASTFGDTKANWKLKLRTTLPLLPAILGSPAILSAEGELELSGGINLQVAKNNLMKAIDNLVQNFRIS